MQIFILVFIKLIIQMLLKYFHQILEYRIYGIIDSNYNVNICPHIVEGIIRV